MTGHTQGVVQQLLDILYKGYRSVCVNRSFSNVRTLRPPSSGETL